MRKTLVFILAFSLAFAPLAGLAQTTPAPVPRRPAPAPARPVRPITPDLPPEVLIPVPQTAPGGTAGVQWIGDFTRQLPMTLEQAKNMAREKNQDLVNARRDLRIAELDIVNAYAIYDPYVAVSANYSSNNRPSSQSIFGSTSKSGSVNVSSGLQTITGGSMSVDFTNSRSETDSIFSTLNPSYSTGLALNVRQPLLRNRFNDTREMELGQRRNDLERSRLALESKEYEVVAQTENLYWSLVSSRLNLDLQRQSYALAERMQKMTLTQVRAGVSAQVATLQTDANVASAKAAVIRTENDYRKAQAALKIYLNFEEVDLWALEIVPTDLPQSSPTVYDRQAVLEESVRNNYGLRQAMLSISNTRITLEEARNRTLPQLDFNGSVSLAGLAGTDHPSDTIVDTGFVVPNPLPSEQFPQPYMVERMVVPGQSSQYDGDYFDSLNNLVSGDNLSWSAGLSLNVPIGNRAAKADMERSMLNYEKQLSDLRDQQRNVVLNIINIIYDLDAAERNLVAAADASRLQKRNLEVEEKKFQLGLNTIYEVDQARDNYEKARQAEISAQIEYMKAKGSLERARKGYVGGAGGVSAFSFSMPAGAGSLPAGIDSSLLQQYSSMLPAGIDINSLRSLLP